jgi:hypothetical protein
VDRSIAHDANNAHVEHNAHVAHASSRTPSRIAPMPNSARAHKPPTTAIARALQRVRDAVNPSLRANFDFRTD